MRKVARAVTQLNLFIGRWASLAIFIIFALLLADVVMRYMVGRPAIWTAELATLIFGVYAIIAGGSLLAQRGHVNVDIFYGRLSPRRKALVDIVTWPLFLLFVFVLLWQGYDMASESIADMERSNSVWKAPLWPTKTFIPIAAFLLFLQGLVRLWSDIRVLRGLPVDEETFGVPAPLGHDATEVTHER
ncbi:TRAP transporter small permease subunit [Haematobacter genomosp. 1]|uniref:TRAP transporter small permease protein n=1 Tax=Haematobacter genomosp. 1 TaxID=366618 RepID=A0A212ADW4_9RHOB|nr:TRAP transporter small permease subunit [Haematobacter genomosp. 1]OWJ79397.1 ABC transporter substrate-binding protein [Haematobacter genomosp. 1]